MSTYYYIVCDDCKEITDAASRTAGGYCNLGASEDTLLPFIITHAHHNIDILSEHNNELHDVTFIRWTEENVKGMIRQAEEDGRWLGNVPSTPNFVLSRNLQDEIEANEKRQKIYTMTNEIRKHPHPEAEEIAALYEKYSLLNVENSLENRREIRGRDGYFARLRSFFKLS